MVAPEVCKEFHGNTILAWCCPITDEAFLLENVQLNDVEKEKLQGMTANRRRHEWLTTRWLLQTILSKDVEISYQENGKPVMANSELSISISHCHEIVAVLLGVSAQSVGIDCESVAPRILKIKHKFAKHELPQIKTKELEHLTMIWCAKEALFKLHANGSVDFNEHLRINDFDFSVEGGTFTGTILKEETVQYNLKYKYIQNSLLVWVSA